MASNRAEMGYYSSHSCIIDKLPLILHQTIASYLSARGALDISLTGKWVSDLYLGEVKELRVDAKGMQQNSVVDRSLRWEVLRRKHATVFARLLARLPTLEVLRVVGETYVGVQVAFEALCMQRCPKLKKIPEVRQYHALETTSLLALAVAEGNIPSWEEIKLDLKICSKNVMPTISDAVLSGYLPSFTTLNIRLHGRELQGLVDALAKRLANGEPQAELRELCLDNVGYGHLVDIGGLLSLPIARNIEHLSVMNCDGMGAVPLRKTFGTYLSEPRISLRSIWFHQGDLKLDGNDTLFEGLAAGHAPNLERVTVDARHKELRDLGKLFGLGVFRKVKELKVIFPRFSAESMTAFLEGLNTDGASASLETLEFYEANSKRSGPIDEDAEKAALVFVNALRQGMFQSISNFHITGGDLLCGRSRVFPQLLDVLEGEVPCFKGWKNLSLPYLSPDHYRRLEKALPEAKIVGSEWRYPEYGDDLGDY